MENNFRCCNSDNSITYKAGIYTWAAERRSLKNMMTPQPPAVHLIPGMQVGCLPYHVLMSSTLECFYDETCLNTTAGWISTLPSTSWPKPLNGSSASRFTPRSTISSILMEQMVERWINNVNFTRYFEFCMPAECIYTTTKRNDIIYILITLFGSFGGFIVVLRIVSPLTVQFWHSVSDYFSRRNQRTTISSNPEPGNCDTQFQTYCY